MITFLKILVIALFAAGGYQWGGYYGYAPAGAAVGLILGVITLLFNTFFEKVSTGRFFGAFIGLLLGILFARFLIMPFSDLITEDLNFLRYAITAIFGYGGMVLGAARGKNLTFATLIKLLKGQAMESNQKILDTSVIIDGRIADVCETGFVEGTLVVPQFILQELQHIADSADSLRRARGRRGLDVLHRIQKMSGITVKIVEEDFPKIKEVDAKLVALAKMMDAKILTNDFNLNKVAALQGVSVLNINELANALKPVVLPGETMKVFVLKEGKEHNQGVAYLDDGTMVVVENGRRFIGKNIDVSVTSVLQTTAGRMIFSRPKNEHERHEVRA